MAVLVIVLLGLLAAGLSMLVWEEQFRANAVRLDQFTDDSLERGWRFKTIYTHKGNRRIDRWDSLSGGWTAESVARYVHAKSTWDPRILRWWNAERGAPGPSGPVVVLLDGDGKAMPDVSKIEGRLARFVARRRFAWAFKRHFGGALSLHGRDLQQVDGLGPLADGFVVLSDQPAEAARRLTPALLASVRQVWSVWPDIGVKRTCVALCGDRIAFACVPERQAEIAHVAALVEAGFALARARG